MQQHFDNCSYARWVYRNSFYQHHYLCSHLKITSNSTFGDRKYLCSQTQFMNSKPIEKIPCTNYLHYPDFGVYYCLVTLYTCATYLFIPKPYITLFKTFLNFIKTVSNCMCLLLAFFREIWRMSDSSIQLQNRVF